MLALSRIHAAASRIRSGPELDLESEAGSGILRSIRFSRHVGVPSPRPTMQSMLQHDAPAPHLHTAPLAALHPVSCKGRTCNEKPSAFPPVSSRPDHFHHMVKMVETRDSPPFFANFSRFSLAQTILTIWLKWSAHLPLMLRVTYIPHPSGPNCVALDVGCSRYPSITRATSGPCPKL